MRRLRQTTLQLCKLESFQWHPHKQVVVLLPTHQRLGILNTDLEKVGIPAAKAPWVLP